MYTKLFKTFLDRLLMFCTHQSEEKCHFWKAKWHDCRDQNQVNIFLKEFLCHQRDWLALWQISYTKHRSPQTGPQHFSTIFNIIQQYSTFSTIFNIIQQYSTLFYIIQHHSTLFNNMLHYSTIFDIFRQYATFYENSAVFNIF